MVRGTSLQVLYVSPLFLPLPPLEQVERSPQLANTLALVPKTEGGQDKVGEKTLFKQPQGV